MWAEYWRLWNEIEWSQEKIASVKGVNRQLVNLRIKFHESLHEKIKRRVSDKMLDEGHCEAIISIMSDIGHLQSWLTTSQAQIEFTNQLLDKPRGSSAGIKPETAIKLQLNCN